VHEVASQSCSLTRVPSRRNSNPATRGLPLEAALDKAKSEDRVLVLGLHGGRAENGELQAMCELRGDSIHRLRLGVVESRFRQCGRQKTLCGICGRRSAGRCVALENLDAAFAKYGRLIAKPARGRIELWPDLRQCKAGSRRGPQRRQDRGISDRAVRRGRGGDLRRAGAARRFGAFIAADRNRSGGRRLRLHGEIPAQIHSGDLSGTISPEISAALMDQGACGRTGRCRAAVIPGPTSSSR